MYKGSLHCVNKCRCTKCTRVAFIRLVVRTCQRVCTYVSPQTCRIGNLLVPALLGTDVCDTSAESSQVAMKCCRVPVEMSRKDFVEHCKGSR